MSATNARQGEVRMWKFIVAPHRGRASTGLWSVQLGGSIVGIHASYADAMHDAVHRAAAHSADDGSDSQIVVDDAAERRDVRIADAAWERSSAVRSA